MHLARQRLQLGACRGVVARRSDGGGGGGGDDVALYLLGALTGIIESSGVSDAPSVGDSGKDVPWRADAR